LSLEMSCFPHKSAYLFNLAGGRVVRVLVEPLPSQHLVPQVDRLAGR
jgi:hypothetical protein